MQKYEIGFDEGISRLHFMYFCRTWKRNPARQHRIENFKTFWTFILRSKFKKYRLMQGLPAQIEMVAKGWVAASIATIKRSIPTIATRAFQLLSSWKQAKFSFQENTQQ